jgi:hypothetical protein
MIEAFVRTARAIDQGASLAVAGGR